MEKLHNFLNDVYKTMSKSENISVKGIVSASGDVISLGTDSKILGRIFEIFTETVMIDLSKKYGIRLLESSSQTVYPDFTLEHKGKRIALDVKSAYRKSKTTKVGFTLGSFASYLRNNTKNIHFPYDSYEEHWVIGFIYKRNTKAKSGYIISDSYESPYLDVEVFLQEKYKIAGEKPGSGNTENIGSIKTADIDHFRNGIGPFSGLGEDVFENYWRQYPKYRQSAEEKANLYSSLEAFLEVNNK